MFRYYIEIHLSSEIFIRNKYAGNFVDELPQR